MRNTFKVLFYIKRNALLRNGLAPVVGRITINGQRTYLSTHQSIDPKLWDANQGRAIGRTSVAVRVNEELFNIRFRIEKCYNTLFYSQSFVTPTMVKELYFGVNQEQESLLTFFRMHNEEFNQMVGVTRSKTTYYKYRCVCQHLEKYISIKFNKKDLMFKELNKEFLTGFHAYIVQECSHRKNTTWIYMIALKHILMLARSKGYLDKDLFANYKLRTEFVSRNYLNADEINRLIELEPSHSTLRVVRDAFIFSCFTGLSYVDIHELTMKHIQHIKDQVWIMTRRAKTGTEVNVRLFSIPYEILLKYTPMTGDTPIFLLPSNGWCNQCLNQLMDMAKIDRRITFHSARHTFATTITLSQGVAIETISKLLGHRNIRTTQIYATITHARLNSEMEQLSKRLNSLYGASNVEKTGIKQRYEEMEKFDSPRKRAK